MTDEKKPTGPFRARDFRVWGHKPAWAGEAADQANAKLAELWTALEWYDHAALQVLMRRDRGNAVLAAFRALREAPEAPAILPAVEKEKT